MDLADDAGDVLPTLFTGILELPRFRITDIVEVYAVDIVTVCHLAADASDVITRLGQFWVHIVFLADLDNALWIFLA